ncbi:MAG: ERCC4 domain-containing protein [Bacteroidota bacterium]|nr:ERCC4 domain-containing protein [Bacteroidota bacterium]
MTIHNLGNTIIADYHENTSGIPQQLIDLGIDVKVKALKYGDYIINDQIIVERKTKNDFALSLMQNRLFIQCSNLKKTNYHQILLVEGNPYNSSHNISRQAIKGALLSISVSWQIPIVFSSGHTDTAQTLALTAEQNLKENLSFYRTGYKPKNNSKKQLYFLQGLPLVGTKTAQSLIKHFGSIEKIISANELELQNINGIGKGKATGIRKFILFDINQKK